MNTMKITTGTENLLFEGTVSNYGKGDNIIGEITARNGIIKNEKICSVFTKTLEPKLEINWAAWGSHSIETTQVFASLLLEATELVAHLETRFEIEGSK